MKFTLPYILLNSIRRMPYYAVAKGRKPGIYTSWDECRAQVHQYSGPVYKKFASKSEAQGFINGNKRPATLSTKNIQCQTSFKRGLSTESKDTSSPQPKKRKTIIFLDDNTPVEDNNKTKSRSDFIIDKNGYTNVYTDGACSGNGRKGAKAGIGVWFGDDHPLNVSEPVLGRPTNNTAEIQAVTKAALEAKKAGIRKLKINTDSKFLISCITVWMPKWKSNGWKTVDNKPVINKDDLIKMENALASLDICWNHVNGHVGIHGNEMADKLAREGCSSYCK